MGRLQGKVAIVTGGTSGIGLASAKLFQREGATLVVVGRDPKALEEANRELGGQALAVRADIARLDDLDALYARVREKHGRIDVLFANAGVPGPLTPLDKMTSEVFDEMFGVNARGTYFTVQKALPLLAKGASVILTTSIANQVGRAGVSAYAASKAAVRSLTQSFAAELVGRGIRVNALSPGATHTPMLDKRGTPEQVKTMIDKLSATLPMKRLAQSEDMANVALFLASDESAFVLGQELVADGGLTQITVAF